MKSEEEKNSTVKKVTTPASKAIVKIKENYVLWEKTIVDQLNMSSQHHVTTGGFREEVWKSIFDRIVPRKFTVARSVFIIDSSGGVSHEVDLAIFDEQYTPYIFQHGQMKYIPIEAVSVAVQCKSKTVSGIRKWAKSIRRLKTSFTGISRMATLVACGELPYKDENGKWHSVDYMKDRNNNLPPLTQTATRPILILCHMAASVPKLDQQAFDIIITPGNERLKAEMVIKQSKDTSNTDTIAFWLRELNHSDSEIPVPQSEFNSKLGEISLNQLKVWEQDGGNEISLLTLTFQLNQLLMLINNPLLFPHQAYAKMFNDNPIPTKT